MPVERTTSAAVLAALREGPFKAPAHAFLTEVRNSTGYRATQRYADALAVSLWPSRGIWFAGVEVKVARSDWKRELDNPMKSAEIQRWCDYWWLAAPAGIVEPHEVPEAWGFFVIHDGKRKGGPVEMVKQAPKLTPEPPSASFVASVLRNHGASLDEILGARVEEARASERASLGDLPERLGFAEREVARLKRLIEHRDGDLANLRRNIAEFQQASGVEIATYAGGRCGQRFAFATSLESARLAELIGMLENSTASARAAFAEIQQLRSAPKPAPSEPIPLDVSA